MCASATVHCGHSRQGASLSCVGRGWAALVRVVHLLALEHSLLPPHLSVCHASPSTVCHSVVVFAQLLHACNGLRLLVLFLRLQHLASCRKLDVTHHGTYELVIGQR